MPRNDRRRILLFAATCVACALLAAGYAWMSISRSRALVSDRTLAPASAVTEGSRVAAGGRHVTGALPPDTSAEGGSREAAEAPAAGDVAAASGESAPASRDSAGGGGLQASGGDAPASGHVSDAPSTVLMFRHTELDRSFGALAIEEVGGEAERRAAPLQCNRVYFRGGHGVCLTVDRLYPTHSFFVFDDAFEVRHRLPLGGLPSRARISPDGRLAATTVFVFGHSYADGDFSTETSIIDLETGNRLVPNLQAFEVSRGNGRFHAVDFNFWGVTFAADSDRFYATLRSGGQTYLVEGTVSSKRARVLRENVECPSLSPDNTRLVFKKRVSDDPASMWRLHALELATMVETPLAESRSVDDQVEWLDDGRVAYSLPRPNAPAGVSDVWVVPADGSGVPAILLAGAASPAVVPHAR